MRREALVTLLRIREEGVGSGKAVLAQALAAESDCLDRAEQADQRIVAEAEAALDLNADDHAVEAYARWLPQGRAAARRHRQAAEAATAEVVLARTALSLARVAELAAERALARHDSAEAAAATARDQRALDDIRRSDRDH